MLAFIPDGPHRQDLYREDLSHYLSYMKPTSLMY